MKECVDKYMSQAPHTIGIDQTLATAHEVMRENNIRHLPVLRAGQLVGLLSDRDIKLVESLKDVDPRRVTVEQAMTDEPYTVNPLTPLETAVRDMARRKVGSAVVVNDGHVVGIFTAIDALQALAWLLEKQER